VPPAQGRLSPAGSVLSFKRVRAVRVHLRGPRRETLELAGRRTVAQVLAELGIDPGTVLVIRGDELLTPDVVLGAEDEVEVRPVVSGG